mmetsp:Transcript_47889/g.124191  ORF Transcript_47889/g.124191 Transcript_47889/m.124191 type:complete len:409 (+) Transcript_47889:129-1355(+)
MSKVNSLNLPLSSYTVHGAKFEAPKNYTVLEPVGQGAYGVVCSAECHSKEADGDGKKVVAIKKIENAFEHLTFAKRTLRELRILRHLRHENLIDVRYVFLPGVLESFEDIYIVSELMETDLASILKSPQPLSDDHTQFFLYQVLRGLKYLHSAQVIHRDLKPRNLLVNQNCDLKICDYGLARVHYEDGTAFREGPLTEYICTRWYRAPEVLCSWTNYGKSIDIWSVGCIFAEMIRRKALFPGRNTQNQLQMIVASLGSPERECLKKIPNDKCRKFIESLPTTGGKPLAESVPRANKDALDFMGKTLCFSPDRRSAVGKLLEHSYVAMLHCPEDEPTREPLETEQFEFERRKVDIATLREEVFLEALEYHPERRREYQRELESCGRKPCLLRCRLLEPGESQYSSDEEG